MDKYVFAFFFSSHPFSRNTSTFPSYFGPIRALIWDDGKPIITGETLSKKNKLERVQMRNCGISALPAGWENQKTITHLNLCMSRDERGTYQPLRQKQYHFYQSRRKFGKA